MLTVKQDDNQNTEDRVRKAFKLLEEVTARYKSNGVEEKEIKAVIRTIGEKYDFFEGSSKQPQGIW